jgi:hypothetical protein
MISIDGSHLIKNSPDPITKAYESMLEQLQQNIILLNPVVFQIALLVTIVNLLYYQ